MPGVPGCLKQYQKLCVAISDAHNKHRSLTVCWLDLANAYGSVHHGLIKFALDHYRAPPCFLGLVSSLYTDLRAIITCQSWSTKPIPLELGVYQGDLLSVVIFNTVMATLTDTLKDINHWDTISPAVPDPSTFFSTHADDTCILANGPASCQELLWRMEGWLDWTGMRAKVPKCFSLAIVASSGKRYNPWLTFSGQDIPFIKDNTIRFLGGPVSVPPTNHHHKEHLAVRLEHLLQRVDAVPVTRKQKLMLYKDKICPRLHWDQSVIELPFSWVKSMLEAKATRF